MLEKTSEDTRVAQFLRDKFYITAKDDNAVLAYANLDHKIPSHAHWERGLLVPNFTGYGGYSFGVDNDQLNTTRFIMRLRMAVFGGLALIVPMLIMRLHPTLLTQLLTASLFILAFGLALAIVMDKTDEMYIASATAAYAAVLVVFVGSSSSL